MGFFEGLNEEKYDRQYPDRESDAPHRRPISPRSAAA